MNDKSEIPSENKLFLNMMPSLRFFSNIHVYFFFQPPSQPHATA
jgi:hypothetical protein